MRKEIIALGMGVTVSAALAMPATAQTVTAPAFTTIFTNGSTAIPSYTTAQTPFQTFATRANGQTYQSGDAYQALSNETVSGTVNVMQGTTPGIGVQPTGNTSNSYLDIVDGSYGVSFATAVQFFSFDLGSLDNYNSVQLTFANGASVLLTGEQIIGMAGIGPLNSTYAGRVSYDVGGGSGITNVLFSSTQPALEIDSLVAAVPEAATWAMMMVGLGIAGGVLRRRRAVATQVTFA